MTILTILKKIHVSFPKVWRLRDFFLFLIQNKKRNTTLKRKGGTNDRELADLKYQVNDQKSKLAELASENADLKTTNSKLQEMLKGEQQVNLIN